MGDCSSTSLGGALGLHGVIRDSVTLISLASPRCPRRYRSPRRAPCCHSRRRRYQVDGAPLCPALPSLIRCCDLTCVIITITTITTATTIIMSLVSVSSVCPSCVFLGCVLVLVASFLVPQCFLIQRFLLCPFVVSWCPHCVCAISLPCP